MTRTAPITAAVLTAAVLALAACGGNAKDPASSEDKAFDGAVAFSRCMRAHGVNLPDPQRVSGGGIKLTAHSGGSASVRPDQPRFQAAQKACQKYFKAGGGPPADPAEQAKARDALVAYAGCMRAHGVDMPDPKTGPGGGILIQSGGPNAKNGPRPDSPVFKTADKACHGKLAGLPGGGPSTQESK